MTAVTLRQADPGCFDRSGSNGRLWKQRFSRTHGSGAVRFRQILSRRVLPRTREGFSRNPSLASWHSRSTPTLCRLTHQATVCAPRGEGEAASGIVPRCRARRLWGKVCDLRSSRAAAPGCRSHHHGCRRAVRAADRLKWLAVDEAASRGLRRSSDRDRPRLPNLRL